MYDSSVERIPNPSQIVIQYYTEPEILQPNPNDYVHMQQQ